MIKRTALFSFSFCFLLWALACSTYEENASKSPQGTHSEAIDLPRPKPHISIDSSSNVLSGRFAPPSGYQREAQDKKSFTFYLRHLPLKTVGSSVRFYDGGIKNAAGVYAAVVDQPISSRDLQQCADAVMRLRGEWLYSQKRYSEIHFNFLSDGKPRYYKDRADAQHSYKSFRKYMDYIFAYANTASLKRELKSVALQDMQIGDVFIQSGNPYGHAITVVDMAVNAENGKKVFMLAQSYMPAQETQILINRQEEGISPWYRLDFEGDLYTPEWTFGDEDLRRW